MSLSDLRCPGQNLMFWKPDDIYDVACPGCGKPVEFWKDDSKRTCECGHRFSNPKRDLGCLEYCKYAEACMPEMFQGANLRAVYRDRLVAAIRSSLKPDAERMERISQAADLAERFSAEEGGDPKVAIAATIISSLLSSGMGEFGQDQARAILSKIGTEAEVIEQICRIAWEDEPEGTNHRIVQNALSRQADIENG